MKRSDSWSEDDDRILTETVLNCVKTGESQLEAFEYVGEKLSRSPAACGFRWNSKLRKMNEKELQQAKIEGQEYKKLNKRRDKDIPATTRTSIENAQDNPLQQSIDELLTGLGDALRTLQEDNDRLRREVVRLEGELENVPKSEDFKDLLKLLAKAKQQGLIEKETPAS